MKTRRDFLQTLGAVGATGLFTGLSSATLGASEQTILNPLKFGVISDIHCDLTPDAEERLEIFMKHVDVEKPDFLIDLGDFAFAIPQNENFAKRFTSSKSPAYHVLGNHDMDRVDKKDATAFFGMPSPYYSFDIGGYHCVVFDPNNIYSDGKFMDYEKGNYFSFGGSISYVSDDQCDWLESDLRKTTLPTFLFSHQSLLHDSGGIPNRAYVQRILERENERCGFQKILACFNGHHHQDFYRVINGIHYFSINSAAYQWHDKISGRYPEEMVKKYPHLDNMSLYQDSLFCFVTVEPSGKLSLHGVQSEWAVTPPGNSASRSVRYGRESSPAISNHDITLF